MIHCHLSVDTSASSGGRKTGRDTLLTVFNLATLLCIFFSNRKPYSFIVIDDFCEEEKKVSPANVSECVRFGIPCKCQRRLLSTPFVLESLFGERYRQFPSRLRMLLKLRNPEKTTLLYLNIASRTRNQDAPRIARIARTARRRHITTLFEP